MHSEDIVDNENYQNPSTPYKKQKSQRSKKSTTRQNSYLMDQKTDAKPEIYEKQSQNSIEEIVEKPSVVRKRTNGDAFNAEDIEIELENTTAEQEYNSTKNKSNIS